MLIDLLIEILSLLIGRPLQRTRARRFLRESRGQCVLSYPSPRSALMTSRMSGIATFAPGSIELSGWRTHVLSIELPGREGFDLERQDTRMGCGPKQVVYTLHTQRGTTELTLLKETAPAILDMLRVAPHTQSTL